MWQRTIHRVRHLSFSSMFESMEVCMSQPQSLSSGKPGGEATLGISEQSHPPGETMAQGDPAARNTKKERNITIISPERLSDLNLVNYLLAKQKRDHLVQTHIVTERGRLVLGVRAYPKSHKSPAVVAFIVLDAQGEFAGQFTKKEKALQMQVYGMWNTPAEYIEITERLRKVIPGVIPVRKFRVAGRRRATLGGERLSVALIYSRKKHSFHPASTPAA